MSSLLTKNIPLVPSGKSLALVCAVPRSIQRRFAVVTKRGAGCDGRGGFVRRVKPVADGQVVSSRSPDAGIKPLADVCGRRRWLTSPVHRGEHEAAVNTNRACGDAGMFPVDLSISCAFLSTLAHERAGASAPGIPHAPPGRKDGTTRTHCAARTRKHAQALYVSLHASGSLADFGECVTLVNHHPSGQEWAPPPPR
jgi:hypothetical protein